MNESLNRKQIFIFLGFAFGIAWLTALVIYLTGGLFNSPLVAPNLPLFVILLAIPYMWAPALANILTRLITHEGWANAGIRPYFKRDWLYWIIPWVLPGVLTILGALIFFALFPQYYIGLTTLQAQYQQAGQAVPANLGLLVIYQTLFAILISPIANGLATFGEEFGWRAYLLPRLMPLGERKAVLLLGVIWGIWHWPVIMMGYEYGFRYTGFPWLGMLLFVLFTTAAGALLAWVTLKGRSVWPAVIGHGAINGIAAVSLLFADTTNLPLLLGPAPIGIIAMIPYLLTGLILFLMRGSFRPNEPNSLPLPDKVEQYTAVIPLVPPEV